MKPEAPSLQRIDLRGDRRHPGADLPRPPADTMRKARETVAEVLADVHARGDRAVAEYTARFDGWDGTEWEVPQAELDAALAGIDPSLRAALETAREQVQWFHEQARPRDWAGVHAGDEMGVRHAPLKRVGVYVPGGRAAYPSTVLMTVVPARVAGVDEVVVATPPGPDGRPNQTILAAAALVGADRVLRIGGAQAVAALAYGTEQVRRVDKVVGPGNAFVAEAKLQVAAQGLVGIDAMAGVTEVMLIADDSADPRLVATSLIAQAEHDPLVTSILVTPSVELADAVVPLVAEEVDGLASRDRLLEALSGQGAIVLVDDLDHAVAVADDFAPEHLRRPARAPSPAGSPPISATPISTPERSIALSPGGCWMPAGRPTTRPRPMTGCVRPAPSSWVCRRQRPSGTTAPVRTTPCPLAGPHGSPGGCAPTTSWCRSTGSSSPTTP